MFRRQGKKIAHVPLPADRKGAPSVWRHWFPGGPPILVYGDSKRIETAAKVSASVQLMLAQAASLAAGLDRHALLVGAFIRAAELAQGVADAEFERCGEDRPSRASEAAARLLRALALEIDYSWRCRYAAHGQSVKEIGGLLDLLAHAGTIGTRTAEGYAHYALYPECYLEAARLSGLGASTCVIGIRSIGLGLAALVAAALGARAPVSLRPVGHPFAREIRAAPGLVAGWVADRSTSFAIVDEGPGLSGSSFAAVIRWLEGQGVETSRIHLFPSHDGPPGESSSAETRRAWSRCTRHVADFEATILGADEAKAGLRAWLTDLIGPHESTDISGGRWRHETHPRERRWPPSNGRLERRKFLLRSDGGTWVARFAGLGAFGLGKLRMARLLEKEGFGPEIAGFCHGFLVEKWQPGATLDQGEFSRAALVQRLGCYLGARMRHFPAAHPGAGLDELRNMALANIGEALGGGAAARLARWFETNRATAGEPVAIDGRLHPWEFVMRPDGVLIKTDALDHCQSHDLVGCQDIAWDVAGAAVEHDLSGAEIGMLCATIAEHGSRPPDPRLAAFYMPCYLAFQLGLWDLAAGGAPGAEKARLDSAVTRYRDALGALVGRLGPLS